MSLKGVKAHGVVEFDSTEFELWAIQCLLNIIHDIKKQVSLAAQKQSEEGDRAYIQYRYHLLNLSQLVNELYRLFGQAGEEILYTPDNNELFHQMQQVFTKNRKSIQKIDLSAFKELAHDGMFSSLPLLQNYVNTFVQLYIKIQSFLEARLQFPHVWSMPHRARQTAQHLMQNIEAEYSNIGERGGEAIIDLFDHYCEMMLRQSGDMDFKIRHLIEEYRELYAPKAITPYQESLWPSTEDDFPFGVSLHDGYLGKRSPRYKGKAEVQQSLRLSIESHRLRPIYISSSPEDSMEEEASIVHDMFTSLSIHDPTDSSDELILKSCRLKK